jgi:O-methyltransferase involved in polyketide biosynthesis
MSERREVNLGPAQETMLIPLYGRAVESRKKRPLLRDAKAVEMVESLDYDFAKFDGTRSLGGSVLRGMIFDSWVSDFLREHPGGTVVEIGAGLNTRFERLDNGTCHWVELDLPDAIALRRQFFEPTDRRSMVAGSVTDPAWLAEVREHPGPYFFIAEAVLLYVPRDGCEAAIGFIREAFPGSKIAFDTAGAEMVDRVGQHNSVKLMSARFQWSCEDPRELESWGLRLLDSRNITQPQRTVRLPFTYRLYLRLTGQAPQVKAYRMNLFTG